MAKYVSANSYAEESGALELSKEMLKAACPGMFGSFGIKLSHLGTFKRMCEYIQLGDSQPAVVYSLSPFLVAAYADEMDAVVLVRFDDSLVRKYGIVQGQRMISVNVYDDGKRYGMDIPKDIDIGAGYLNRWTDFTPHIGDLLSENKKLIEIHKANIPEEKWQYVAQLASEYAKTKPGIYRDGSKGLASASI